MSTTTTTIEGVRTYVQRWLRKRAVTHRETDRTGIAIEYVGEFPGRYVVKYRHVDMSAAWTSRVQFALVRDDGKHTVWEVSDLDYPNDRRTVIHVPAGSDMHAIVSAFVMRGTW